MDYLSILINIGTLVYSFINIYYCSQLFRILLKEIISYIVSYIYYLEKMIIYKT